MTCLEVQKNLRSPLARACACFWSSSTRSSNRRAPSDTWNFVWIRLHLVTLEARNWRLFPGCCGDGILGALKGLDGTRGRLAASACSTRRTTLRKEA